MTMKLSELVSSAASSSGSNNLQTQIDELMEQLPLPVNAYDDIPPPNTVKSGKRFVVVNDPDVSLRGLWVAAGADVGQPAQSLIPT